jgi:DNA-binding MarR family transcriptional regulator
MSLKEFVLKKKPTSIILCLKRQDVEWYPSKLAKETDTSYVYVTNWLIELEKEGWVRFERKGRSKRVVLTENGGVIASLLDELVKKIDEKQKKNKQENSDEENAENTAGDI